jgi:putative endonuclease
MAAAMKMNKPASAQPPSHGLGDGEPAPNDSHHPVGSTQRPTKTDLGSLGEQLVATWLQRQGWRVLAHHWHCRWGELDLVVGLMADLNRSPLPTQKLLAPQCSESVTAIAFVEVKTRSDHNWDAAGALAITRAKQRKLCKAAQLFLAKYPDWQTLPCQFDVALVHCQSLAGMGAIKANHVTDGSVAIAAGYRLTLHEYLPAAFSGES